MKMHEFRKFHVDTTLRTCILSKDAMGKAFFPSD